MTEKDDEQMTEEQAQKALLKKYQDEKRKLNYKYGILAKKRLSKISSSLKPSTALIDMTDENFNSYVKTLLKYKNFYYSLSSPQREQLLKAVQERKN